MNNQIYQHQFIHLEKELRNFLIKKFNIPKTAIIEVVDDRIICDGVCNEDLKILTPEVLSNYVGMTDTLGKLWDLTVAKARIDMLKPEVKKEVGPNIVEEAIKVASEPKQYCGACVTHHGRHRAGCPTGEIIKNEKEKQI
jgi:hypothetical protein